MRKLQGAGTLVAPEWSQDTKDEELMGLAHGAQMSEEPQRDVKILWSEAVQLPSEMAPGQVQSDVPWHRTLKTSPLHQEVSKVPSGKKYLAVAVDTSAWMPEFCVYLQPKRQTGLK